MVAAPVGPVEPPNTDPDHGGGRRAPSNYGVSEWSYATAGGTRLYNLRTQTGRTYPES